LSKQNNPSSTTSVKSATRESHSISRSMSQDLWGNLIYFLIVTIAICFVLVNNTLSQLMTTTGIVLRSRKTEIRNQVPGAGDKHDPVVLPNCVSWILPG